MSIATVPVSMIAKPSAPFRQAPRRLLVWWLVMTASMACYVLGHAAWASAGGTLLTMAGAGACGWAWLFARAVFDPAASDARWPRVVAGVVAVSGALSSAGLSDGLAVRVIENIYVLSGSAALLMTLVEPFLRHRRDLPAGETRFRVAFVTVYVLLVAVSVLAPGGAEATAEEARRIDLLKSLCAAGGMIAGAAALTFRTVRPLVPSDVARPRRTATSEDRRLAQRILDLLDSEALHTEPTLKVGDVAARVGQPEYRVSQCVTAVMGFDNFNRMINHHRIALAKRLLVDVGRRRSILDVAFECGFGSVGPFNRAFKAETGVTPRAFRAAHVAPDRSPAVTP